MEYKSLYGKWTDIGNWLDSEREAENKINVYRSIDRESYETKIKAHERRQSIKPRIYP